MKPDVSSKVNGCFFLVLLCFFIIPGILYLVWAGTQTELTCPRCKAKDQAIPLDSPEARKRLDEDRSATAPSVRDECPCPWCAEPILRAAKICKHCKRDIAA